MLPVCYPSSPSPVTGLPEAVAYALSSVSGLTRWVDYIPVKLVGSPLGLNEQTTNLNGFVPMRLLGSAIGMAAWSDYIPVYVDNSATEAWVTSATGYIPYANSVGSSRTYPATFNVLLSNPVGCTISDSSIAVTIQSNPIIPRVSLSRTTGKAPLAVGFDATTTTSPLTTNPNHDLFYAWSFGDAAGETWTYGATTGLDKNAAYGPVAGHVFKTDGTFTWTLTVMDGLGNIATSSGSVVVSAWATADTIYIANGATPVAGANGVPVDATNLVNATTWANVAAQFAANKRIMLRKGDTWACGATTSLPSGCEVNAYGTSGANPIVTSSGATMCPFDLVTTGAVDSRICNITHNGPGPNVANSGMVTQRIAASTHLLMLGLESNGSTFGFINDAPSVNETFIQDCYFHGYGNAGLATNIAVYATHAYGIYILGSFFDQAPSHVVRLSGVQRCVVDSCKIRRPDGGGAGRHALTIREIGDNTPTWVGEYTQDVVVSNNDIDSSGTTGLYTLHIQNTTSGNAGRHRRVLVERNMVVSDNEATSFAVQEMLTVRSNIFKTNGASSGVGVGSSSTLTSDGGPGNPSVIVDPQFYNNTVYAGSSGAFAAFSVGTTQVGSGVTGAIIRNNLIYAPSTTAPTLLSTGKQGVTGTVADHNSSDAQMLSTRPWTAVTPSVPADYTPTGYALGAGVFDYRSQKDFFNAAITAPVDMGAIQA